MTLRLSDPCISIAELFHENTKETKEAPRVPTIDKADLRALNGWRWGFAACPAVALPPCSASDGQRSLSSLLKSRRSVRRFSDLPLPLGSVGALLSMSAGVTNVDASGLNDTSRLSWERNGSVIRAGSVGARWRPRNSTGRGYRSSRVRTSKVDYKAFRWGE